MVVRINYRQSFARVVGYAFKSSKQPEIVAGNMSLSEPDGIIQEFTSVSEKNTRCKSPVAHLAFSLGEGESLKLQEWDWLCREVADNYGFKQYVAVKHRDTSCKHIHLIENRIQLNGKAAPTSNDRYRMRELCHKAEERFSLQSTPERSEVSRISKNELEKASRLYREGKMGEATSSTNRRHFIDCFLEKESDRLSNCLLTRAVAKGHRFKGVDFKYTIFDTCYFRKCSFEDCDFTGCRFSGSNFSGSVFNNCKFD